MPAYISGPNKKRKWDIGPLIGQGLKLGYKAYISRQQQKSASKYQVPAEMGSGAVQYPNFKKQKKPKVDKAFVKKLMKYTNPPVTGVRENSFDIAIPVNKRMYADLGVYDTNFNPVIPHNSKRNLTGLLTAVASAAGASAYDNSSDYWILKRKCSYEVTNTSNAPVYMKVHIYTLKTDATILQLLEWADFQIGFDSNANYPNEGAAATALMTVSKNYCQYTSDDMQHSALDSEPLKQVLQRIATRHTSKEHLIEPQGVLKFNLKTNKPFLFSERMIQQFSTDNIESLKGLTKFVILEVVGQTARGGTGGVAQPTHAIALPSHISVLRREYIQYAVRSFPTPKFVKLARADLNSDGTTILNAAPLVYGADNNAPVLGG